MRMVMSDSNFTPENLAVQFNLQFVHHCFDIPINSLISGRLFATYVILSGIGMSNPMPFQLGY